MANKSKETITIENPLDGEVEDDPPGDGGAASPEEGAAGESESLEIDEDDNAQTSSDTDTEEEEKSSARNNNKKKGKNGKRKIKSKRGDKLAEKHQKLLDSASLDDEKLENFMDEEYIEVEEVDMNCLGMLFHFCQKAMAMTCAERIAAIKESASKFFPPGNMAAGLASGLHVLLYVVGLAMILSTKYFGTKECLELGLISTLTLQVFYTLFGSYKHFAIANADTLPAAVMVSVVSSVINYVEKDFKLNEEIRCGCEVDLDAVVEEIVILTNSECSCLNPGMIWGLQYGVANGTSFADVDENSIPAVHGYGATDPTLDIGKTWAGPHFHTCYEDVGNDGELHTEGSCFMRVQNTVLVAIIVCSTVTGASLFIMGKMKMGSLISFVPFPVQCAFLAACGFKIFKAGLGFMVDLKLLKTFKFKNDDGDSTGLQDMILYNIAPLIGMAVFIMYVEQKFHHSRIGQWLLPLILFTLTFSFYVLIGVYGVTKYSDKGVWDAYTTALGECRASGNESFLALPEGRKWLMEDDFADKPMFSQYGDLLDGKGKDVMWPCILSVSLLANSVILWLVSVMAVLMNSSILEEKTNRDIDFDNELKVSGGANALCGMVGGLTGFSTVPKTMMCYEMGLNHHTHESEHYYSGAFTVIFFACFMFVYKYIMPYAPLPVLGGFVVAIGLELCNDWLIKMKKDMETSMFYEVCILFVIMSYNFVFGFVLGLFMALVVFAGKYARLPTIKSAMTVIDYQGSNVWNHKQMLILNRFGRTVLLIRLQGFIFFFTAEKLRKKIIKIIEGVNKKSAEEVTHLCLDFRMVDEMDGTSLKKIKKMLRYLKYHGVTLCLSSLGPLEKKLDREGIKASKELFEDGTQAMYVLDTYDLAVEYCCERLLASRASFQLIKRNHQSGKYHLKEVVRGIIKYIRLGYRDYVKGEEFDTAAFRAICQTRDCECNSCPVSPVL